MEIDHTSMENAGKAIHGEGADLSRKMAGLRGELVSLIPYFGNPGSDEAARTFRRGADGHPGFDSAYEDLTTAMDNMVKAYQDIGTAVVSMSKNVKAADWASMIKRNASVRDLVTYGDRENDEISVPTTPVERA
ncbi:hypothetical protein OUY22_08055 [Nonomuraea sp. MCN248]|uniref:WXG100 family type VII secretion target n=1 Tax=Nonomuraea corallina TaxID=2989783 RepID=A0ABT4S8W5_9ACTN|nr:hypothetical protein [Nonomuraea corallina]MDA0633371.1 hypothetical protein [Nonomuraea corallina]